MAVAHELTLRYILFLPAMAFAKTGQKKAGKCLFPPMGRKLAMKYCTNLKIGERREIHLFFGLGFFYLLPLKSIRSLLVHACSVLLIERMHLAFDSFLHQ